MPISAAAHKGDTSIMELLIAKGAIVDALNISGSTALIQVIRKNDNWFTEFRLLTLAMSMLFFSF